MNAERNAVKSFIGTRAVDGNSGKMLEGEVALLVWVSFPDQEGSEGS